MKKINFEKKIYEALKVPKKINVYNSKPEVEI